jgi:hypothetical protein
MAKIAETIPLSLPRKSQADMLAEGASILCTDAIAPDGK